jgi:tetratricopeptide (TPR) repeat protein
MQEAEWIKGRYWYFIDNIEVEEGKSPEVLLWVALPMSHRGQSVKIEKIYPEPMELIHDSVNENEIVFWRETELGNKERIFFYCDFQVLPEKVETDIDPRKIEACQKGSAEYKRYIESEPWIEITPEIRKKAAEIVDKETNQYFQAKKIFDWVVENMSYEYPDLKERGAKNSFIKLKGDCGEFSVVFTALCRAVGIPARTVTCIWFTGSGHQWAEILLPPYGWIPVDTSVAEMLTPGSKVLDSEEAVIRFMRSRGIPKKDPDYLFGNLYPNRVIVCIGNNIEVISNKTGIKKTFQFMQPGGATAFPPAIELNGLKEKTVHAGFYVFGDERESLEFASEKAQKELAHAYLDAGLYDKAEKGFLKILEEKPDDAISWLKLGQIHMNKEDYDNAIAAFQKCIKGKAGSIKPIIETWAHNLSGNCYDIKGMRELAITEYKKVIDSNINFQGAVDSAKKYLKEPYGESNE